MTGMTLINYINSKRVIKAKELLLKTNKNVTAIAEEVGFKSAPYFYRTFKKYVGLTPSEYRVVIVD
jgi:YesN/AraC family two-component response regulator